MSEVDVLKEILTWSAARPDWQRDALRRLLINEELSQDDIAELAELCKQPHGLADSITSVPLAREHLPTKGDKKDCVVLESIFHHKGVNALAEGQTVHFGPNLTVVYGDVTGTAKLTP